MKHGGTEETDDSETSWAQDAWWGRTSKSGNPNRETSHGGQHHSADSVRPTDQERNELPPTLVPLLLVLARAIADGGEPSDSVLRATLIGAGLDEQPGVEDELRRWRKLLALVRGEPSPDVAAAVLDALVQRGVPDSVASGAVALIVAAAAASSSMRGDSLVLSVRVFHLGTQLPWFIGSPGVARAPDSMRDSRRGVHLMRRIQNG